MADSTTFRHQILRDSYRDALQLGLVTGVEDDAKFGHCPDAGAVITDVWELGLTVPEYVFPVDAGEAIEAVSDNAGDAIKVTIAGLGVNGLEQTKSITLNGLTPVPVPGVWRAVNRAYNGNGTEFVGNIQIRGDGSTSVNVFAAIAPDDQQTSQAIIMVPADKVDVINNLSSALNRGGGVSANALIRLTVQPPGGVFRTQIRYGLQKDGTTNLSSDLIVRIAVPPLSRVKISAEPSMAGTDISAEWSKRSYNTADLGPQVVQQIEDAWK